MPKADLTQTQLERFERCYAVYRKKKSRGQAETTWKKWDPDEELTVKIFSAITEQNRAGDRYCETKYLPNFSTYLNAKGWLDEIHSAQKEYMKQNTGWTCVWCDNEVQIKLTLCKPCEKKYKERDKKEHADNLVKMGIMQWGDTLESLNIKCRDAFPSLKKRLEGKIIGDRK